MVLSPAVEDYLKTIYKLDSDKKGVSTKQLAAAMEISAASATNMIKRLAEKGFVEYESYKGARLTPAGEKISLEIIRHHRLLELYLLEIMGYSWDEVHEEAEKLEHHISEQFEDKIAELLNDPTHDPHGDPIPTKEGTLPELEGIPLVKAQEGEKKIISRIMDQDPDHLRYLEKKGLIPGACLTIIEKEPFNGPLTLQAEEDKTVIGRDIAASIFIVEPG